MRSIASITKLMTAMVVLDAQLDLDEQLTITSADRDPIRGMTGSRLAVGATLTRRELLLLALMFGKPRRHGPGPYLPPAAWTPLWRR